MKHCAFDDNGIATLTVPTPFSGGHAHAYLIKGETLDLIDTGVKTTDAYEALTAQMAVLSLSPGDLDRIFITHGHIDHTGLLNRLVDQSGAQTFAHPLLVERAAHHAQTEAESLKFAREIMLGLGVPSNIVDACLAQREHLQDYGETMHIDHALADGKCLGNLEAHHVPGHSATDILYIHPARHIAFTGDHLLKSIQPIPLIWRGEPGRPRPKSLLTYRDSLHRTAALDLALCYPGHGATIANHRALIKHLFSRQQRRANRIQALLDHQPQTPYEILLQLSPKIQHNIMHLWAGLSLAQGFLELLEHQGRALAESQNGILHFRAA